MRNITKVEPFLFEADTMSVMSISWGLMMHYNRVTRRTMHNARACERNPIRNYKFPRNDESEGNPEGGVVVISSDR